MFLSPTCQLPSSPPDAQFSFLSLLGPRGGWRRGAGGCSSPGPVGPLTRLPPTARREEKTEQLVDTRHEVDQLVLELQKVKQEVSRMECACVSVHMCVLHLCPGGGGAGTPQ